MMWGNGMTMAWGWTFGLLVLVGMILLVVWAVQAFAGRADRIDHRAGPTSGAGTVQPSRARQILDERFAAGDLTAEEYREHLHILTESRGA